MPGGLTLLAGTDTSIPTPAAGKVTIYFSTNLGVPAYKDDLGVVHTLLGATGGVGPQGIEGQQGSEPDVILALPGPQGNPGTTGSQGPLGVSMVMEEDAPETLIPFGPDLSYKNPMVTMKKTGNQTINAGAATFVDITDLTFPVQNGKDYAFYFYIVFQSALASTGWKAGVNCPNGTLDFQMNISNLANNAAGLDTWHHRHNTVRDDMTLLTATITASVDLFVSIQGRFLCTADGTFAARFANELAANTDITVRQGSWGWYF